MQTFLSLSGGKRLYDNCAFFLSMERAFVASSVAKDKGLCDE
jgi:hypothetical protein